MGILEGYLPIPMAIATKPTWYIVVEHQLDFLLWHKQCNNVDYGLERGMCLYYTHKVL